ncbi:MAG: alpha/beta hydrolase [Ferruginibacter sp.]|nr:alpha/beta hydrolase [Cytophagales bacterium]
MKTFLKWLAFGLIVLLVAYLLGPSPDRPRLDASLPRVPTSPAQLERDVNTSERLKKDVRSNNQARIVWADSARKTKTPYSILYLHGFSASQEEGAPVHTNLARRFGCNLYLARLEDHGTKRNDVFMKLNADNYLASAKRALAIANQLGDSVIVVGTSAGGMLGLGLTSLHPRIAALVLYSPAVALFDPASVLLDKPWGLQIARRVFGSDYSEDRTATAAVQRYWTQRYRLEGVVALQSLISNTMTPETFGRIRCPVLLAYYYKNEEEQDKVVSVPAMLTMFDELATPASLKRKVAFPDAADHVIASHLRSKEWPKVERETVRFLEEVVKLKPAVPKATAARPVISNDAP